MIQKVKAFKNVSWLWVGSVFGAGSALIAQILLARNFTPAEFGVFVTALTTVTLLIPLAGFGVAPYWLKVFGQEGWEAKRWFLPSFKFTLITMALVVSLIIIWAILGPHDELLRQILVILSLYVLGQVFIELVSSKLQLEEKYIFLTLWLFLPHFIRLLLIVAFIFLGGLSSIETIAYIYTIVSVLLVLSGVFFLYKMFNGSLRLKGHVKSLSKSGNKIPSIKEVALGSWPFGLVALFHLIYFQSDIIFIQYFISPEAAGVYNVAFIIMVATLLFPGAVYQKFLLPKIHRWANHDRKFFYKVYKQGNLIMLVLGVVAMLLVWALAPWLIVTFFGIAYEEAINLLLILSLSIPVLFVASSVGATLETKGFMIVKVKIMGLVAVLNITLNVVLIPKYGSEGAAVATVVSNSMLLILYFFTAQKRVFKEGVK